MDTEPDAEQDEVSYDQARAVVWAALQANHELAERELLDLADHVGIDVLMLSSNRMRNANDLWSRATEELREVGNEQPTTVREWLNDTIREADELRSEFEDDDDAGRTTKRRSSSGIRCPVPELDE